MEIDTALLDGDYFYAGSRDKLQVVTSTSSLTREEIQKFWQYACERVLAAGIPY